MTARAAVSLFCDNCGTFVLVFSADVHAQSSISVNKITRLAKDKGWLTRNEPGRIYALVSGVQAGGEAVDVILKIGGKFGEFGG